MKIKTVKAIALILAMICILCFPVPASAISQGTDGTELQVMKPEKLEIRLGEDWAGVEFDLSTDAGKYPGVIVVGEDGVLRMEIGGSENYILSCLNSVVEPPHAGDVFPEGEGTEPALETDDGAVPSESVPGVIDEAASTHIPVKHMMMFGVGLVLAIGVLAAIHFSQKPKSRGRDFDDEDNI